MITSAAYKLGELNSYPLTPAISVIPAKAGIHCDGSPRLRREVIYRIAYHSEFIAVCSYGRVMIRTEYKSGALIALQ